MSRRPRISGGGRSSRSGGSVAAPLLGYSGLSNSVFASTANPGGVAGIGTGFWGAALFRIDASGSSTTRYIVARSTGGPLGWLIRTLTTNATLMFGAVNGAAALVSSPTYAVQASDIGKVHLAVGVHDGSNVRLYVARAEVGSGTPITGYTAATTLTRMGANPAGSNGATNMTIFGWAGGHAVPTLAQVQAYFDAVKSARRIVAMPGVATTGAWPVGTSLATVTETQAGTDNMTVTGTPTLAMVSAPVWGW